MNFLFNSSFINPYFILASLLNIKENLEKNTSGENH
jgi:hypothetical protein